MERKRHESIPVMDYRQYRRARRLVHECCNYDCGNCIALDDGEECVCVQNISYSLLCRWFRAAVLPLDSDEYIDPADGLIHCKNCGGNRQTVVPTFGKPGYFMPRCICPCQVEAERRRKEAEEQCNRMESIKRRKAQGLQERYLYDYTFANDNGQNPLMKKARAYVDNWKQAYRDNTGLLLFGDVGTGKSIFAGCIANALLDRDIPVLMKYTVTMEQGLITAMDNIPYVMTECYAGSANTIMAFIPEGYELETWTSSVGDSIFT